MNLPGYEFIPGPLWLITALHLLTLTLHFVAMNFLLGGVVIVLWGRLTGRWEHPTVRTYIKVFPAVMATTISLGVAPLLFLQLVYYDQAYSAAIVSAWFWLSVIPAVILAYALFYRGAFSGRNHLVPALLALLYVAFVYSSVFSLAEQPGRYMALYVGNQSGLMVNPDLGSYLFRYLHMVAGAVTVGGFFFGLLGRRHDDAFAAGRDFFLWGMAAAGLLGFIYLVTLGKVLAPLVQTPAIWAILFAIVLSAASLYFFVRKRFAVAGSMLLLSLLGMVFTRHTLRLVRLAGSFDPSTLTVRPQWSVFLIFLVCFVLAIGTVYWMVRAFFATGKSPA